VDSYVAKPEDFPNGQVNETLDRAEDNNFTCEEIFISEPPEPKLRFYLPLIVK
jgi:hypothetical protein